MAVIACQYVFPKFLRLFCCFLSARTAVYAREITSVNGKVRKGVAGVPKTKRPKALTGKQRAAAQMLGKGMRPGEVAQTLGLHPQRVSEWQWRDDFCALRDETADKYAAAISSKALKVTEAQLDLDPERYPPQLQLNAEWVRGSAAQRALSYAASVRDKQQAAGATVVFSFDSPGAPDDTEQGDADSP